MNGQEDVIESVLKCQRQLENLPPKSLDNGTFFILSPVFHLVLPRIWHSYLPWITGPDRQKKPVGSTSKRRE